MKRRRSAVPSMSLSLLDMLFSTFGGVILLAFVFSAMIDEMPVIATKPFYKLDATISTTISAIPKDKQVSDLTVSFLDKNKKSAAQLFEEGVRGTDLSILSPYQSKLGFFISRKFSTQTQVFDYISIVYVGELPNHQLLQFRISSNEIVYDLCKLSTNKRLTVKVEEQVSLKRSPIRQHHIDCDNFRDYRPNLLNASPNLSIPNSFMSILTGPSK